MLITNFGTIASQLDGVLFKTITIDSTKVDATLTDYPVMVKLTTGNFDFSEVRTDGMDISFYDMSDNLLPSEREYFLTNSQGVFHVKIPSVSASVDTTIKMVYGNGEATDLSNKTAVWDANFVMVQHMGDSLLDSTSNGNDGTNSGTTVVDGLNGKARSFNGTNQRIDLSGKSVIGSTTQLSISVLVKRLDATAYDYIYMAGDDWDMHLNIGEAPTGNKVRFSLRNTGGTRVIVDSSNTVTPVEWVYLTVIWDGTTMRIYINGVESTTTGSLSGTVDESAANKYIGSDSINYGVWFGGLQSTFRTSNISRSDAWIKADDFGLRLNTLLSVA
jgi:biopolymer transport protein ExbB